MAQNFTQHLFNKRNIAIAGIGIGIALWQASKRVGAPSIGGTKIPTEQALSIYSVLGGLGGAASQIIASNRLSQVEQSEVGLETVFPALAVTIGASAASAILLPNS